MDARIRAGRRAAPEFGDDTLASTMQTPYHKANAL
jgi:hypothetical protein